MDPDASTTKMIRLPALRAMRFERTSDSSMKTLRPWVRRVGLASARSRRSVSATCRFVMSPYCRKDSITRVKCAMHALSCQNSVEMTGGSRSLTSRNPGGFRCAAVADGGTTASVVALLQGHLLVVANVGDSRVTLGVEEGGRMTAVAVSDDHKPDLPKEKARITAAGGRVFAVEYDDGIDGPPRVWLGHMDVPGLAMR